MRRTLPARRRLALRLLRPASVHKGGDQILATGITGDFVLPRDPNQKILAIASGVGIAPFMSMFRYLKDSHERRDIALIYSARTPLDFIFQKEIDACKDAIGLKVFYLPLDFSELSGWNGLSGPVTAELVRKKVPDFAKRTWYLSGTVCPGVR